MWNWKEASPASKSWLPHTLSELETHGLRSERGGIKSGRGECLLSVWDSLGCKGWRATLERCPRLSVSLVSEVYGSPLVLPWRERFFPPFEGRGLRGIGKIYHPSRLHRQSFSPPSWQTKILRRKRAQDSQMSCGFPWEYRAPRSYIHKEFGKDLSNK